MIRTLLPCCFLVVLGVNAQPVLRTDKLPAAGTVYAYHDVPYLKPLPPQANMRWDYTALPSGAMMPYQWSTTLLSPGSGAFPTESLVLRIPGEPAQYYLQSDSSLMLLGSYGDTELLRFDPPLRPVSYPSSIGMDWQDSGVVALSGSGRIALLQVRHTVKADAWGSLAMPYGVIQQVIRLRSELVLIDPKFSDQPVSTEVRYTWYCDQTPMPLLTVVERSGWNPPDGIMRWLDGSWREGEQSLFRPIRLRVFPDPCVDHATIDLPATGPDQTVLQLINSMGKIVKTWNVEFTQAETRRLTLQMSAVPTDHYTLQWVGSKGTIGSVRLEKQ